MSSELLMRAPIALLPVLLFLAGLVQLDGYKLVRIRMMLALVAAGAVAAGVSFVLNSFAYLHLFAGDFRSFSLLVAPLIEESLKAALVLFLIRTRRVGLPVDAGIAGFAIGTGFALVENMYYLAQLNHATLPVQVIRGFGTAIMHGGTATVLAMISNTLYERRPSGGLHLLLPGLLTAVALHAGFNFLLSRPALATLSTLLVLPFVVLLVFEHSENILRTWIEVDLETDVKVLESISAGRFLDTPSGRYLHALRDRFPGEQLVDMLCYLRVHNELAVRAKGILLLRESGIPEPPIEAETRAKLAELAQLQRAIGKTGVIALRPLMMATGKETWQLTLLRQ